MLTRALQVSLCALLALVALSAGQAAAQTRAAAGSEAIPETLPVEVAELLPAGGEGYRLRTFGEDRWWLPEAAFYVDEKNPAGVWMRGGTEAEVLLVRLRRHDQLRLRLRSLSAGNVFRVTAGEVSLEVPFAAAVRRKPVPVELPLGEPVLSLEPTSERLAAYVYRLRLESTHGVVPRDRNPKSSEDRNLGTLIVPRQGHLPGPG